MTLLNLQRACRRSLVLALLLCVAGSGAASEADRRLDAIKQALVDLSLGSELRLATSAYVDERGVLHESSLVTSQAQIRGVRVLAYLQLLAQSHYHSGFLASLVILWISNSRIINIKILHTRI